MLIYLTYVRTSVNIDTKLVKSSNWGIHKLQFDFWKILKVFSKYLIVNPYFIFSKLELKKLNHYTLGNLVH